MATWARGIDFKNTNNTKRIGGVGVYGTDTNAEKLYIGIGSEPWNNAGLQLTSSSINFKGNKIYHAGDKPTASEIGAAASSHTHSYLPLSGGTVTTSSFGPFAIERSGSTNGASICFKNSNGTLGYVGMQGGANSGLKRWSADTNTMYTILDSGNYKDTITPANIGAAASSHTHSSLKSTDPVRPTSANLGVVADRSLSMMLSTSSMTTGKPLSDGYILNFNWDNNGGWASQLYVQNSSSPKVQVRGMNAGTWGEWNTLYGTNNKPTPADIGAAPSNHTHKYAASSATGGGATEVEVIKDSSNKLYLSGVLDFGTATSRISTPYMSGGTITATTFSGALSGNASTATKLQNARTINGTSFDGTGNITTANWGTARTLTIGNTGKSVNGSGNVAWSLSEIGAAPSSHTHNYAGSSSAGGAANLVYLPRVGGSSVSANYQPGGNRFELKEFANDCANMPSAHWYHILTGQGSDANYNTQLALGMTNNAVYFRNRNSGAWGNWKQLAFTDSSITGNSATATKLKTARTINGTNFDGSANITTSNWGTTRTITIGNTGKSVNGSGNISWSLSEIGAAASSHNHGLLHDSFGTTIANTTTDNGWSMINSSYNGFLLKSLRSNSNAPAWLQGNYSAGIAFGGGDTKGVMSVSYNSPSVRFAGGNGSKPVWYFTVNGSSGKTYNMDSLAANTANTLTTARTINGTSFNGSANITTANWGTARTITIGSTGKSVNGSGNVSWSLSEIGAAASSHTHNDYLPLSGGTVSGSIKSSLNTGTYLEGNKGKALLSSTNSAGSYTTLLKSNSTNGYFTLNNYQKNLILAYTAKTVVDAGTNSTTKQAILLDETGNTSFPGTVTATTFNGNASTATKLQTARAIKIGNTSRNFDGSANLSWSLNEIGALPLTGGTLTGETTFNNYLSINAWSGYGTGKSQLWFDGNSKNLVIENTSTLRLGNNVVYHTANKPTPADIGAAANRNARIDTQLVVDGDYDSALKMYTTNYSACLSNIASGKVLELDSTGKLYYDNSEVFYGKNCTVTTGDNGRQISYRYPNGMQINVLRYTTGTLTMNSQSWGSLYTSGAQSDLPNYIQAFSKVPTVVKTIESNGNNAFISSGAKSTTTWPGGYEVCRGSAGSNTFIIQVISIGRWK